ncbi:Hexokinase [Lachnellula willkommii]|uniref:Phosphotransferase n=1 Tax=Lachnellula willkommii TaxID=215461 RepID=A0A559M2Y1_9HELO|nr:Hexokinase [Lachnellula willkommii]
MTMTGQSLDDFLAPLAVDISKVHSLAKSLCYTFTQLARESQNQFLSTPISDTVLRPENDGQGRGGTNLRVGFIELLGSHNEAQAELNGDLVGRGDSQHRSRAKRYLEKAWPIGEQLKNNKAQDLFQWIEATLMSMGKGFAITSNLDLGKLLLEGYESARDPSLPPIKITAIVNDSVATLVSFAYQLRSDPKRKAAMGLIVGTGCNATIPLAISKLHPSKRPAQVKVRDDSEDSPDLKITVNTEWTINGAAPPLHELKFITPWDTILDAQGEAPGFQPFEYMTSGRYLGELGRLIVLDYFVNQLQIPATSLPTKLLQRHGLTTTFFGNLGPHLSSSEPSILKQIETELPPANGPNAWHWTYETADIVFKISKAIQRRAAGMTAAAVIALLGCADEIQLSALPSPSPIANGQSFHALIEEPAIEELMVGYTGGCIMHFQDYLQDCQQFLDDIMNTEFGPSKTKVPRVLLTPCHDGGIIGAGILAGTVMTIDATRDDGYTK